jgi:tellurite resistance protein TehA-like permease
MIDVDQIPIFIAIIGAFILLVLTIVWLSHARKKDSDAQAHDRFMDWIFLGLLLIAIFVLGAFITYIFFI